MALLLEETIMREIGLGQHYNWFNGSGSCMYVAQTAMRKLPDAIQEHVTAGEKIAPPDSRLMALARETVDWDESTYTLTKAWQVASEVIAAHIHAASQPEEEQGAFLQERLRQIRKYYQPAQKQSRWREDDDDPWFQMLKHMNY